MNQEPQQKIKNPDRLCSVYCPNCKEVTNKISFNLLEEAGNIEVRCDCGLTTYIEYTGGTVRLWNG
jgi:lysyl-tRNA synthetase class I